MNIALKIISTLKTRFPSTHKKILKTLSKPELETELFKICKKTSNGPIGISDDIHTLQFLLQLDTNINCIDTTNKKTPLMYSSQFSDDKFLLELLKYSPDHTLTNINKHNAIDHASNTSKKEILYKHIAIKNIQRLEVLTHMLFSKNEELFCKNKELKLNNDVLSCENKELNLKLKSYINELKLNDDESKLNNDKLKLNDDKIKCKKLSSQYCHNE